MIARLAADIVAVLVGIALLAFAIAADRQWLDRHFLPPFFVSRRLYVLVAAVVRVMLAILGVALALVLRPRIGRFIARVPPGGSRSGDLRRSNPQARCLGAAEISVWAGSSCRRALGAPWPVGA